MFDKGRGKCGGLHLLTARLSSQLVRLLCKVMATDFFEVAQPLDHDTFLSITHEVLQWSLLVLAPLGLPR